MSRPTATSSPAGRRVLATLLNRAASLHPALIEARLAEAITRNLPRLLREHGIPGAQISFAVGNRPIRSFWRGMARTHPPQEMSAATRWRAASLSKPVAAIVALRLAGLGHIDLDRPDPDSISGFFRQSCRNELCRITPRLLLCHRGGLANTPSPQTPSGSRAATLQDALHGSLTIPHEPGARTVYAGVGYSLLQHMLERTLGRSFAELAREHCFDPLGLHEATFDSAEQASPDLAAAHDAHASPLPPTCTPAAAATGLVTSSRALVPMFRSVLQAARGRPQPLNLNRDHAAAMLAPQPGGSPFTLGLHLLHDTNPDVLTHGGILPGLRSLITVIPRRAIVFAGVANSDRGYAALKPLSGLAMNLAFARH